VIGFSQGGAAAGMVAALLEEGRREAFEASQSKGGIRFPDSFTRDSGYIEEGVQGPLKFAVSYSGFAASTNPLYQAFYEPRISTPMMHFLGSLDTGRMGVCRGWCIILAGTFCRAVRSSMLLRLWRSFAR
jgi:hypothetical protein